MICFISSQVLILIFLLEHSVTLALIGGGRGNPDKILTSRSPLELITPTSSPAHFMKHKDLPSVGFVIP